MMALEDAIKIVEKHIPKGHTLCDEYGEAQGKYIFASVGANGLIPPGGFHWTVDKETGECKCERLEREFLAPYAPIRGYKKLELTD